MPLPTYYNTGTASVANGATTISFAGAGLGSDEFPFIQAGDMFAAPGQPLVPEQRIASVDYDAGTAELWVAWPGTTLSAAAYEIRLVGDSARSSAQTRRLLEQMSVVEANGRGLFYRFATATTDADPGAGYLRLNHATIGSATAGYLDNADANGATVSAELDTWDDSTSTVRGKLWLRKISDPAVFHAFSVTGSVVDGTGYRKLTLAYVGGSGTFAADDELMAFFVPKGDKGTDGTNGTNGTNGVGITPASSAGPAQLDLAEDTDNGTNKVSIKAPAAVASDKTQTLQDATGTIALTADIREKLTANRTYYVRTDGSDSNNGLANTSGGAFLTIQKAVDVVSALDLSVYDVTIQLGNGTYSTSTGLVLKSLIGSGSVTIIGDTTTPTNVVLTTNGAMAQTDGVISATAVAGKWKVRGFRINSTATGTVVGLLSSSNSFVEFQSCDFGSGLTQHVRAADGGVVRATGNYSLSAGGALHLLGGQGGVLRMEGITVTVTGTPAFATAFAVAAQSGIIVASTTTFSGGATGTRYSASLNGVINTNGGGASVFPGDVAGTTATGGQYA